MLLNLSSSALTRLDVAIDGRWTDERHADWKGIADGPEPLVSVVFVVAEGAVDWCKSERGGHETQVRLALFWYDDIGQEVQVNFSALGGNRRLATRLPRVGYRPLVELGPFQTGATHRFALVDGDPTVECYLMFIASRDVQVGRRGIWHARDELVEVLEGPIKDILTYGRTGQFETAA